jgi:hypothetical protein
VSDDEMKPEAWRLLQVVREADSPSDLDMRRVRRAIAASAGAALAAPVARAASAATSKGLAAAAAGKGGALMVAAKGLAAIAVLASLGAGTVWWSHHKSRESTAPARIPARSPESSPGAREPVVALGETAAPSTLLEELTLLQRAQRALAGGAPREALTLAGEHATRYPRSQLARERDAVRVFAECALGQRANARALAIEILKSAPRSPLRTSLEQSCAAPLRER